jgi:hypothetical protein
MTVRLDVCFGFALLLGSCAPKRLPPGTPAPEYEERPVAPWPSASAAADPSPPAAAEAAAPAGPDAGSEALDAGAPFPDAGVD